MRHLVGALAILGTVIAQSSCVSLNKINYPAGLLVTQSQWSPGMNSTTENKPIGQVRYHSISVFMPKSIEEALKDTLEKAEGRTLTNLQIQPFNWFVFHTLDISGEVSRK